MLSYFGAISSTALSLSVLSEVLSAFLTVTFTVIAVDFAPLLSLAIKEKESEPVKDDLGLYVTLTV